MNRNYCRNGILILCVLLITLQITCVYKRDSIRIYSSKETSRNVVSVKGEAKVEVRIRDKNLNSKMSYCYDVDSNYFIADFRSIMNSSIGYLVISREEIFFYLMNQNAYVKSKVTEEAFSKICGIYMDPFRFIGLLQGVFKNGGENKVKEIEDGGNLFNYYKLDGQWIIEHISKKSKNIEFIYIYKNSSEEAVMRILYNKSNKAEGLEVKIKGSNLNLRIKKRKESLINKGECEIIDIKKLEYGDLIDIEEYDKYNPLILDLLE